MKSLKLSICICSLHSRRIQLDQLLDVLWIQSRYSEIEILVAIDAGQALIGVKRNRLVQAARGEYVVHIDDDDLVHGAYIPKILHAIDNNPGVDAIVLRGERIENGQDSQKVLFDYRVKFGPTQTIDNVVWRSPGHLCPVRRDLAQLVLFPDREPEDLVWCDAIAPYLHTEARAGREGEVLYYYRWDSTKYYRWEQPR